MLQQFLSLIQAGEFQSLAEIARQMQVSAEMVRRMAGEMAERGYLEEIRLDCNASQPGCGDCPVKSRCQPLNRQWILTEKGRAAVSGR